MISVIYCTRSPNRGHYDHIRKTSGLANKIEVIEIVNEGEDLTKAYNRGLKQATNDIVVFCHDDIIFNKNGWARKLVKHFNDTDYGILGIAGTTNLDESGKWWQDQTKMVGIVKHSHDGKTFESKYSGNFGNRIIETVTVDGLFFAVHKGRIKETFDEAVKGFHFYEIDFCLRNHLAGVKLGVVFDVKVTHKSIGQTNEEWEKNRLDFALKYEKELPINIEVNPEYEFDTLELSTTPRLKIFLSTEGDKEKIQKSLNQIEDSGYPNYIVSIIGDEEKTNELTEFESDKVSIHESVYPTLHKNLSVLRWDNEFVNEKDELIMFLSDNVTFKTNIINKFISVYNKNNKLGCIFPRILNSDNTILSCGFDITLVTNEKNETQVKYSLKGLHSYYNYSEGLTLEPLGNLGFCFMTTYQNLTKHSWFRLDFDKLLYEADFSAKCSLENKDCYVDNDSVVQLSNTYLKEKKDNLEGLSKDFSTLVNCLKEIPKSIKYLKTVYMPSPEALKAQQQKQQQ